MSSILQRAVHESQLVKAMAMVQSALKITPGTVAADFLRREELTQEAWTELQRDQRAEKIGDYLALEAQYEGSA